MSSSRRDVGLEAAARALEGLRAWDAQIGIGSFLTIDLGGTFTAPSGSRRGAFMLWIYGAAWQVLAAGEVASDSEQERGSMVAAANLLKGRRVQRAEFREGELQGRLVFEGGIELKIEPLLDDEMEEWLLYLDDGTVIVAGPGHVFTREGAIGGQDRG